MAEYENNVEDFSNDVENNSDSIFYDSTVNTQMEEVVTTSLPDGEDIQNESSNYDEETEINTSLENSTDNPKEDNSFVDNLLTESEYLSKNNQDNQDEVVDLDKGHLEVRLPLARVKKIMKCDPFLGLASQDSIFLVAKATELFIESLALEAYQITSVSKKKTVSRKDIDTIIERIDALAFLDGALD